MNSILILLATHNGRDYLAQQLDSILAQDSDSWHLVLSDDGSTDGTQEILRAYADAHPRKITHYISGKHFGSACDHFLHLLQTHHDADYIMFCDQDDVWHADKISRTLAKMRETEKNGAPALVFTDMQVVDETLRPLHPSFLAYSGLSAERCALHHLLMQNNASGNTIMINAALAQLAASRIPSQGIRMHDWWLALIAAAMGRIGVVPSATMDYRQHGHNAVGAKGNHSLSYIKKRASAQIVKTAVFASSAQAEALLNTYADQLQPDTGHILKACARIQHSNWLVRRWLYLRYGLYKSGLMRLIAQLLLA